MNHPQDAQPSSAFRLDRTALPVTPDTRAVLAAIDHAFVEHPIFGDSLRIKRKVHARYRLAVDVIADAVPGQLALPATPEGEATLSAAFESPFTRYLLERCLKELREGRLQEDAALVQRLASVLAGGFRLDSQHRVGKDGAIALWSKATSSNVFAEALEEEFRQLSENGHQGVWGVEPTDGDVHALSAALELLEELLPESGPSAVSHIRALRLLEAASEGGKLLSAAGGDAMPSIVFMSREQLKNTWDAAGHLYHEGLHLKLFDVVRSGTLSDASEIEVEIPWRKLRWNMSRVVFSYHVYAHVILFQAVCGARGPELQAKFGIPQGVAAHNHAMSVLAKSDRGPYATAIGRADFLSENLSTIWRRHLTPRGKDLVDWLDAQIAAARPFIAQ